MSSNGVIDYNSVFIYSSRDGHLDIMKWILHKYPDIIDTITFFYANREAIHHGHLNILKWLLIGEDMEDYYSLDDFLSACSEGHLDVAKWMMNNDMVNSHDIEYIQEQVMEVFDNSNSKPKNAKEIIAWINTLQ